MLNLFLNKYLCSIQSSWNWNGHVTVVLPDFREWQRLWLTVIWSVRHQARALERHIEHLVNPTHRADKRKHFLPITGKINMQFWLFFFKKQWCLSRTWQKHCCVVTKVLFWVVARWILLGSVVFRSLDVAQVFSVWNQGYFSPMFQSGRRKKFKLLGKVIAQISLQMHDWKCDSSSLSQFYRGDWGNKWSSIMQM